MFKFADQYIAALIQGIFNGDITEYELPENLYYAIGDYLKSGVYKGFGTDFTKLTKQINEEVLTKFTEGDLELLTELRTNVYMFSAAKTYQQVKEMTEKLIGEDGKITPFSEFKQAATEIFETYNEDYLKAEYDTAITGAQEAVKWQEIEKNKDILPLVIYSAIGDACEICQPLDGMTAKVDDPVWNTVAPPNHFNCRCLLEQMEEDEGKETEGRDELVNGVSEKMDDSFKMNTGKDGYVFKEDHPYFSVPKADVEFAQNNFDLPIPEKD